jgi:hypothetical protein
MNRSILFLFFLALSPMGFSQETPEEIITFEPKETVYLLADSVNLREEPRMDAKLVAKLPIGTALTIIRKSDARLMLNGFEMPWYEVKVNGSKQKGFVWGGKIAMKSFRSTKNTDIVFHFGLEKEIEGTAWYQVRVEKNHKELQHIAFEGMGSAAKPHSFTNFSNRGLTNVDDVIYVDLFSEACGDAGGSIVFFWANGTLYNVRQLIDYSDVPVFETETFIYPSDMEGKKDVIILHEEEGEYIFEDEAGTTYAEPEVNYSKDSLTTYRWDGKQLVKLR